MKKKLVFATNNLHKLEEVSHILANTFDLLSLKDINCYSDIPETAETLEGNALLKAKFVYDYYQMNCFADDTGLEVEALNGAPGVYSARYAGNSHDSQANMKKLLTELKGINNRKSICQCGKEHRKHSRFLNSFFEFCIDICIMNGVGQKKCQSCCQKRADSRDQKTVSQRL